MQLALFTSILDAQDSSNAQSLIHFEKRIRPVLVKYCFECHSVEAMAEDRLKGGLLLDSKEGVLRGGESGAAVVPGDVTAGTLLEALRYEGLEMPPDQQLPPSVIADFERWIRRGCGRSARGGRSSDS